MNNRAFCSVCGARVVSAPAKHPYFTKLDSALSPKETQ